MHEDGESLEAEVEVLEARVRALEDELETLEALRSARASVLQSVQRARRRPPHEGEPPWVVWRLLAVTAGLVLVVSGAWALDETLGSVAIVGALALLIWESAA
jgi:hypothetical protein